MAKTMNASVTDGQINDVVAKLRAAIEKHRSEISSATFQEIQGVPNIGMELFAVLRKYVELLKSVIVHVAHVDGSLSAEAVFKATGRKQYLKDVVVATIPDFAGGETHVTFFRPGKYLTNEQLAEEYAKRGLKPAHPFAVAKINEDDPDFADDHPNMTVWNGSSFAAFGVYVGEKSVDVNQGDCEWDDCWWFAGVSVACH